MSITMNEKITGVSGSGGGGGAVSSVNGQTGAVVLTDADFGKTYITLASDYTNNQQYVTNQVTGLDFSLVVGAKYVLDYRMIMFPAGSGGISTYLNFPANTKLIAGNNQAQVGTFPTTLTPATDSHFGDLLPPTANQYYVWDYSVLILDVQNAGTFSWGFRSGGATDVTYAAGSRLTITKF